MTVADPTSLPAAQRQRRERIVDAATTLLAGAEYDGIQMRDVADAGGVALATLYRYFSSKEHLYAAVLLNWAAAYPGAARATRPADDGPEATIRVLMRRAVRAFERSPQMVRTLMVIEASEDPNARALYQQFAAENVGSLVQALDTLDPEVAAAIVATAHSVMITRLRTWAYGRATIRDVDRSVQRCLDLVFSPPPG
jgi:AcrR family transcriptional regulator